MKKFWFILCVLIFVESGLAQTTSTPNVGLQIPNSGSTNWNLPLNYNFNKIDQLFGGAAIVPNFTVSGTINTSNEVISSNLQLKNSAGFSCLSTDSQGNIVNGCSFTSGVTSFNTRVGPVVLNLSDISSLGTLSNNTTGNSATATNLNSTGTSGLVWTQISPTSQGWSSIDSNTQLSGPLSSTNHVLPGVSADGNNGIAVQGGVSATTVVTAETVNAGGYQVSGSAFGTVNLADWTNTGITNGDCPVWNSTTGKWTPGACGGGGNVTDGSGTSTANEVAISTTTAHQIQYVTNFGTPNLADWTDAGVVNGNCPVWNSSTSKWTPGACGGSMVYPGAGIPNSTGSAWGTSYSTTGSGNVVLATSPTIVTPTVTTGITASTSGSTGTCWNTAGSTTTCGASGSVTLQTNGTNNSSQTTLNLINSSANAAGLTLTQTNTTGGTVQGEIAGTANASHGGTGINSSASTGYASVSSGSWAISPNIATQGSIAGISPACDIRAYGWASGNIDSYVQDCINQMYPYGLGVSQTILVPGGNSTATWDNPSTLTNPNNTSWTLKIGGYLKINAPLITGTHGLLHVEGENMVPVSSQFQQQPASLITGPGIYGTLGTAVTAQSGQVVTPTFTSGDIAHMPAGAAITIAGTTTTTGVSATASVWSGGRLVTLTLPSEVRYLVGENLTVSGCSDATLDITNGVIDKVDYGAAGGEQVSYFQSTASATTGTGCSISSFDEDKYETVRLWCSNGTSISAPTTMPSCSSGQFVIYPIHAHSASDVWGAVAVPEGFGFELGHTIKNINIYGCYGMCYYSEQGSNMQIENVGMYPAAYLAAGGMEQTASWVGELNSLQFTGSNLAPLNYGSGGAPQASYPYGLRCDSESIALTSGGSATSTGCADMTIQDGAFIGAGIKIDGNDTNGITAFPAKVDHILFEQMPQAALTIDNRTAIAVTCMNFEQNALQDNTTGQDLSYLAMTDPTMAAYGGACVQTSRNSNALGAYLTNTYWNGKLSTTNTPWTIEVRQPGYTADAPTDLGVDNVALKGGWIGEGYQMLGSYPFGSLGISNNTPSSWSTLCGSNCTVVTTNVTCPDGAQATTSMGCAELDGNGTNIKISTWSGATYSGDHFIYGCYIKPGANYGIPTGYPNGNAPFYLYTEGTDTFNAPSGVSASYTYPMNNWYPPYHNADWYLPLAVATINVGESTSHNVDFYLSPGNGNGGTITAGYGNQFSNCRWTFVAGPNNPSYAGATNQEIQSAAAYQMHGNAPSVAVSAGTTATNAPIVASSIYNPNGYLSIGNASFGTGVAITFPSNLGLGQGLVINSGSYTAFGISASSPHTAVSIGGTYSVGDTEVDLTNNHTLQGMKSIITTGTLKATAALTSGQVIKIDSANANSVVVAAVGDTGPGAVIGFVENSPAAGATAQIVLPGSVITDPKLGTATGSCAIGQFVIVDTTTAGDVKCTGTYTAGTILGYAITSQSTVGSAVSVYVEPR